MDIYFWQNCLSPHQSEVIREMSYRHKITLIAEEELPAWRKEMGWEIKSEDFANTKIIINPTTKERNEIFDVSSKDSIHIFSGIGSNKLVTDSFKMSLKFDIKRGVLSEARNIKGLKGKLRLLKGIYEKKRYGDHIEIVFAIGSLGVEYFKRCGYGHDKVVPFGYFVGLRNNIDLKSEESKVFKIYYVGRITKSKGVKNLINSLPVNSKMNSSLDLFGDGELAGELRKIVMSNQLKNITFHGATNRDSILEKLNEADLLVLPSLVKDGWGVVVNEALLSGVPVIVSDMCGSSIMIDNETIGNVYKFKKKEMLKELITNRVIKGKLSAIEKRKIKLWSTRILPENAALYLENSLIWKLRGGKKPVAPWNNNSEGDGYL